MARDNSSLYVLSIVAVVAVAGMMSLFMGGGVIADDANIVGQAFHGKGDFFSEPTFAPKYTFDQKPKLELKEEVTARCESDANGAYVKYSDGREVVRVNTCIGDQRTYYYCIGEEIRNGTQTCSLGCDSSGDPVCQVDRVTTCFDPGDDPDVQESLIITWLSGRTSSHPDVCEIDSRTGSPTGDVVQRQCDVLNIVNVTSACGPAGCTMGACS